MPEIRLEPFKGGVTVLADDEPVLQTTASVLRQTGVHSGDSLDENDFKELVRYCKEQKAQRKAVSLLSRQGMSKKALTRKLGGDEAASTVVDIMEEAGYINDIEYARGRAELLITRRLHSPARAEYELTLEGVARDIAHHAVEELGCDPQDNIRSLLESRFRTKVKGPGGTEKTVSALRRAGYRIEDIRAAFTELGNEIELECEDVLPTWESE